MEINWDLAIQRCIHLIYRKVSVSVIGDTGPLVSNRYQHMQYRTPLVSTDLGSAPWRPKHSFMSLGNASTSPPSVQRGGTDRRMRGACVSAGWLGLCLQLGWMLFGFGWCYWGKCNVVPTAIGLKHNSGIKGKLFFTPLTSELSLFS